MIKVHQIKKYVEVQYIYIYIYMGGKKRKKLEKKEKREKRRRKREKKGEGEEEKKRGGREDRKQYVADTGLSTQRGAGEARPAQRFFRKYLSMTFEKPILT